MHLRRAIAPGLLLQSLAMGSTATRAMAAETTGTKEACLSAADEGQSLRDDAKHMLAREQFLACAREVCPRIVRDQCTEWLRQLDEATPTVVFGAKDDCGNDVTSARVTSDGKLVTDHLDGKPVALDPGPHDIVFEREGAAPVTVHVVLRTGEKNRDVSPTNAYLLLLNGMGPNDPSDARRSAPFWSARNVTSLSDPRGGRRRGGHRARVRRPVPEPGRQSSQSAGGSGDELCLRERRRPDLPGPQRRGRWTESQRLGERRAARHGRCPGRRGDGHMVSLASSPQGAPERSVDGTRRRCRTSWREGRGHLLTESGGASPRSPATRSD